MSLVFKTTKRSKHSYFFQICKVCLTNLVLFFAFVIPSAFAAGYNSPVTINNWDDAVNPYTETSPANNAITLTGCADAGDNYNLEGADIFYVYNATGTTNCTVEMNVSSLSKHNSMWINIYGDIEEEDVDIDVYDGSWHSLGLESWNGTIGVVASNFFVKYASYGVVAANITKVRIVHSGQNEVMRIDWLISTADAAVGVTPFVKSTQSGNAYEATDAVAGTRWESAFNDNEWIGVNLGAGFSVDSVWVDWEEQACENYNVEYSNDSSSWSTAGTATGVADYGDQTTTFTAAVGKYWRLYCTKRTNDNWGIKVDRWEVYGTPASIEIAVKGNATNITSGDATPSSTDYTDFGTVDVDGGVVSRTFVISNLGSNNMYMSGSPKVVIGGTHASDFTVYVQPTSPVATNDSTRFKIEFNPTTTGTRSATVSIINDDYDENQFTFSIQGSGDDEDYSTWGNHLTFQLNTSATGADVSSDVTYFPVLIRLTSTDLDFADVLTGGADIRFSDVSGNTHYAYHIDRWDNTNLKAEIWVLLPNVTGNSTLQKFRMYYNKSGETSMSSGGSVFRESQKWVGVWHLGDGTDATDKGLTANKKGVGEPADATTNCLIGTCQDFDGSNDYMTVSNSIMLDMGSDFTVMLWHQWEGDATPGWARIFSRKDAQANTDGWQYQFTNDADGMEIAGIDGTTTFDTDFYTTSTIIDGIWDHIAIVFNGATTSNYLQGAFVSNITETAGDNNRDLSFGRQGDHTSAAFEGKLDEIWLIDSVVSDNFIKLAYANQIAAQTFVSIVADAGFNDWTNSRNLYINTTNSGGGANVANNVYDFPLLVRLTSANWPTGVSSTGSDIRFSKSNHTVLNYQIVRWNNAGQEAEIYVNVDTVKGNNSTQYIKMYWGNSTATSLSDGASTFPTNKNFVGVWHMDDSTNATANSLTARKKTNNTEPALESTVANCVVGLCQDFDGGDDYMTVTDNSALDMGSSFSILFWAKNEGGDTDWDRIFSKKNDWNGAAGWEIVMDASSTSEMSVCRDGGCDDNHTLNFDWNTVGTFKHMAFKFNGTSLRMYADGDSLAIAPTMAAVISDNDINLSFGENPAHNTDNFDGKLDEVWLVDDVVSADFIKLAYQNQKAASSFIAAGPDDYNNWRYTKNIPINTSSSGANVSGNVVGIPIPIKLTSSNFTFSQSRNGCPDLRFAKSNGTHIPYQIERCDSTNALAEIWVRPDTIYGNNSTQYIKMYWGNVQAVDSGSRTATFKTADSYQAVYHLGEDGNTTASGYIDATSNNYHGTGSGSFTASTDTVSIIGMGQAFDGTDDYIDLPEGVLTASAGTVSFWMHTPSAVVTQRFAFGTDNLNNSRVYMGLGASKFLGRLQTNTDFVTTAISANTWYHVAMSWDASGNGTYYVNGASVATTTGITLTNSTQENIGSYGNSFSDDYYGVIDEVQVSNVARDANWIKLSYETQKLSGTTLDSPDWGNATLGVLNGAAIRDSAIYIGTDSDSLYKISLTDGSKKWTYNASSYGDVGMPTYVYNTSVGKYQVFASAGNYIIGRTDNGATSYQLFSPINLAATTGNPYVNDSNYLYVTYTNKIGKYVTSTGVSKGGNYPVTLTGIATTVDPLVMNDNLWVATTAGVVWKYDDDGTPLSSYNSNSTLSYPLHLSNNILLIAPSSKDSLIALDVSGMGKVWAVQLGANNTGPPFSVFGSPYFYTVADTKIQKITHNGATGTVDWTYTAAASIISSPIIYNSYIYFGAAGGRYYAISDAAGSLVSGWPFTTATGNANYGPWIDITYNRVLFGTDAGEIDAIDLE